MTTPVTVVTGASSGLGAEFARALARRGDRLLLVARRTDRLDSLAAEVGNARTLGLDLSGAGAAARLIADCTAHGETIDTLINNAGYGMFGAFTGQDPARLRAMLDLNVGALTGLCRAVLPAMIERQRGAILNVASTGAFQAGPRFAAYFASKAYVLHFTEALHEELKPHGIKVSCLCPGPTSTEFGAVAGFTSSALVKRLSMTARPVVEIGLKGLGANRAIVIAGGTNRLGALAAKLFPRAITRKIAGSIKY